MSGHWHMPKDYAAHLMAIDEYQYRSDVDVAWIYLVNILQKCTMTGFGR